MSQQGQSGERWSQATELALRSLVGYFPLSSGSREDAPERPYALPRACFPCQKSAASDVCPGWNWTSTPEGLGPFESVPCPCKQGGGEFFLPLLELASLFTEEAEAVCVPGLARPKAFTQCLSEAGFKLEILKWMYWAAQHHFPAHQNSDWIERHAKMALSNPQRLTLRWWARLYELNQLIHNQSFSLLTRSTVEKHFARRQLISMNEAFDTLKLFEGGLVVLILNGPALSAVGAYSQKLAWLEAFVDCLDERGVGLCMAARQPLALPPDRPQGGLGSSKNGGDYRWKRRAEHPGDDPLESILKKGAWDRLIEALARGDFLVRQIPERSGRHDRG